MVKFSIGIAMLRLKETHSRTIDAVEAFIATVVADISSEVAE